VAFGCPGASHVGDEQEPAFIEEDQRGATSCGVFLYAASGDASSERWPRHPVAELGAPVSGNSTPCLGVSARHDWGGRRCGTAFGSRERSASRSTTPSDSRQPASPSAGPSPIASVATGKAWADGPALGWSEALDVPSVCTLRTTGRPIFWRRVRSVRLPTACSRPSTTGWSVGVASPVVVRCPGVS